MNYICEVKDDGKTSTAPLQLVLLYLQGAGEVIWIHTRERAEVERSELERSELERSGLDLILGRVLGVWLFWWAGEGLLRTAHLSEVELVRDSSMVPSRALLEAR